MIRYIRHENIDKVLWDDCIQNSVNGIIYARSWYLDIVAPGWDALIENNYLSVFPLTHKKKFFIHYLYQPFFSQQLGVFTRNHLTESMVDLFLQSIPPKFRIVEINLNSMNKVNPDHYQGELRVNLELDLIETYENLQRHYNQNTRRNLKKALTSGLAIKRRIDPDELITLFKENFGKQEGKLKFKDYQTLLNLMQHCLQTGFGIALGAFLPDGHLCAGIFFIQDGARWIFHFAASNRKARETGAMFLLTDSFIKEHAGKAVTLDFEGSNDANVARFYNGFGAKHCNYYHIKKSTLPSVGKKLFNFKKRFWER